MWYPTPAELANLRYRQSLQSVDAMQSFLLARHSKHALQAFQRPGPPTIKTPTPAERYFNLLQKPPPQDPLALRQDPEEERKPYHTFVDEYFVRPLVDRAMRAADPEDRALYMQMTVLVRLFHQVVPAVYEIQSQSAQDIRRNGGQFLPPELFKQLESLGGQFLKLVGQHASMRKEGWGRRS